MLLDVDGPLATVTPHRPEKLNAVDVVPAADRGRRRGMATTAASATDLGSGCVMIQAPGRKLAVTDPNGRGDA